MHGCLFLHYLAVMVELPEPRIHPSALPSGSRRPNAASMAAISSALPVSSDASSRRSLCSRDATQLKPESVHTGTCTQKHWHVRRARAPRHRARRDTHCHRRIHTPRYTRAGGPGIDMVVAAIPGAAGLRCDATQLVCKRAPRREATQPCCRVSRSIWDREVWEHADCDCD
jgi:hypothetical protein